MSSEHTPEQVLERIDDEITFHLSIKKGLNMFYQGELWALSGGTARGLLDARIAIERAHDYSELLQSIEERYRDDYIPSDSTVEGLKEPFTDGFRMGTHRAYQLAYRPDIRPGDSFPPSENW